MRRVFPDSRTPRPRRDAMAALAACLAGALVAPAAAAGGGASGSDKGGAAVSAAGTAAQAPAAAATATAAGGDWVLVGREEGITLYRKRLAEGGIYAFRGDVVVAEDWRKILTAVRDASRRHLWVDYFRSSRVVRKIGEFGSIDYVETSPPWPVKDRDVVFISTLTVAPGPREIRLATRSVEVPEVPIYKDKVRARIHSARLVIRPVDGDARTYLEAEFHADPGGWIPAWVVNAVQRRWPKRTLRNLMLYVKRPDVAADPRYSGLLIPPGPSAPAPPR